MQYSDELLAAIEGYLEGKATETEVRMVNDWYHSFDDAEVGVDVNADLNAEVGADVDDADYGKLVEARLKLRIYKSAGIEVPKQRSLRPHVRIAAGIAAAAAVVIFGIWFFNSRYDMNTEPGNRMAVTNDIAPGRNGATLTLANGKVIQLSDEKSGVVIGEVVKYSDGSDVRHPSDLQGAEGKEKTGLGERTQSLTASTGRGQTYQFTLPDGSRVWLNAGSKLEFPYSFVNSKTRNVKLTGEGYFEVSKDKAHPFIVLTGRQKIEVLGTHFNVSVYDDDIEMKTTLLEGLVAVTEDGSRLVLSPGDQAYSGLDGVRARTLEDPEAAIDWKKGKFVFNNESLDQIMKKVGRWYNLDVVYEGRASERTFNGLIRRDVKLSQILRILETGGIKFRIEEPLKAGGAKRIVVMQ